MRIKKLDNKNILFLGMGTTTYQSVKSLEQYKDNITIYNDKLSGDYYEELKTNYNFIEEQNLHNLTTNYDILIKSPGFPFEHKILKMYEEKEIINDIELSYLYIQENKLPTKIISVTGTNGKTSTVLFLNQLLTDANYQTKVCGNIGISPLKILNEEKNLDFLIMELSSFQLKHINQFASNYSFILNITPDHLNMHKDFHDYVNCKKKIYQNQLEDSYLFVRKEVYQNYLIKENFKFNIIMSEYSKTSEERMLHKKILYLNKYNLQLTYKFAKLLNISNEEFIESLNRLEGLEHRIEFVNSINDICIYNDSKATNLEAMKESVSKLENIILLVGGKSKGENLKDFDKQLSNVDSVITYGENKEQFKTSKIIKKVNTIDEAVNEAFKIAHPGQNILLSPASSSFDQFKNYEERGECFKKIVNEYIMQRENQ